SAMRRAFGSTQARNDIAVGDKILENLDSRRSSARRFTLSSAVLPALLAGIGISQAADVHAWLRSRSPAARLADTIARDGRPGDLILILPPAHASSFNFYYGGALEQWAPPFRNRITNVQWEGLVARMQDPLLLARFVEDLDVHLTRGGRVWMLSG